MTLEALASLDEPANLTPLPARADTDSWTSVVANVARLASEVAGTSFVPKGLRGDPAATTAAILYGREVGFPPMTALQQIHVIEGRPSMSSEGMRALVLAAGHELEFVESTSALCRMRARRARSSSWVPLTWTLDDARRANLLRRENWVRYPRAMLAARCTGDLCRMVFPDVIHGFRTVEEAQDIDDDATPAIEPRKTSSTTVSRRPRKTAAEERGPSTAPGTGGDAGEAASPVPVAPPLPPREPPTAPPADNAAPRSSAGGARPELPERGAAARQAREAAREEIRAAREAQTAATGEIPETVEVELPPDVAPIDPPVDAGPGFVNRGQLRTMFREFNRLGVRDEDRDRRLDILTAIVRRPVASSNELTRAEGLRVVTMLASSPDLPSLRELTQLPDEDLPEFDDPLPDPGEDADEPPEDEST